MPTARKTYAGMSTVAIKAILCNVATIFFPDVAHGVAVLDQQKTTSSNKEFGSEIKLQDGCIHLYQQLEKMVWQISKIE